MTRRFVGILSFVAMPAGAAVAQLSAGLGPVAHASSAPSAPWRASAQLSGMARYESPFAGLDAAGTLIRTGGAFSFGASSIRQGAFSPAINGVRAVASLEYQQGPTTAFAARSSMAATTSLSHRRGASGSWLGIRSERGARSSLRLGAWRQLGEWMTIAVSSSLGRTSFDGTRTRRWSETYFDSTFTDTGGWKRFPFERERVAVDTVGVTRAWLETEARFGLKRGPVAFDGVAGWRPSVDSARHARWFRGTATVALARNVALSVGAGTATRQAPFARAVGHYGVVALRFAPAALVRPAELPEITPAASTFVIERAADREYVVRVRLPRARVVELSGDFNGWQPVRLSRERDDSWVVTLSLAPGTYRMNLRVDGERWLPPPGTTAVDDEFNGTVGLVVVR